MSGHSAAGAPVKLTLDEVNELTGDDIGHWLSNPFMTPDLLADKVCWWISVAVTAALREAASELREQAAKLFEANGPHDTRGAALWDAGCHVDPDDGNAVTLTNEADS